MKPDDLLAHAASAACQAVGSDLHVTRGWRTRGHGTTPVSWRAVMLHDTVTGPGWSRQQLTRLLADGHSRLAGPLYNIQLERDADCVLIAAGRAYHAGPGSDPIGANIQSGNLHSIGLGVANGGHPQRWTEIQRAWAVAFCRAASLPALGHYEWAPDRKVDPWSIRMPGFRTSLHDDPDPDPLEQLMSSADVAAALERLADATETDSLRDLALQVADIRAHYGHDPDPDSDLVWAVRLARRTHSREQLSDALKA